MAPHGQHLNEEVLALHRFWEPDISQVRILPFRLRLRSSVDRAPGFDPVGRRFDSYRGLVLRTLRVLGLVVSMGTLRVPTPFLATLENAAGTRLLCTQELSVRIRACPRRFRLRRSPCPDRLLVRTLGFQPGRQGSIPCRGATTFRGSSIGRALDC